jgi:hypothetical protein
VLFGTRLDDLPTSYQRYLVNGIRRELGFDAVPVRLTLRSAKNPFAPKKFRGRPGCYTPDPHVVSRRNGGGARSLRYGKPPEA